MQSQLEQLEQDCKIEWREYKVEEIFEINRGNITNQKELISDSSGVCFIAQNDNSNGFVDIVNPENHKQFSGGSLVVGRQTGVVYYQGKDFITTDGVLVLSAKNKIISTQNIGLFITSTLKKTLSSFSYSNTVSATKLNAIKIQLPTINQNGVSLIAFDFIEKFIATLNAERIATLNAYLKITGLHDYTLNVDEQAALDGVAKVTCGTFKVGELFEKLNLKNHNKSFDKLLDTSRTQTAEFNLPLVNAKLGDNGIMFYGRERDFDSAEMTVGVISNGAVATGTVYAQPQKTGVLWDAYLLKAKIQGMNKQKLLYLTTAMQKSIKTKFGWEDKAVWSKVQYETISLPIHSDNTPNYEYMNLVISAMQKVVIKNVVDFLDRRMAATTEVVGR